MGIKTGIRSYGPGKFFKLIDSYVHELTLDGGADREESYEEGGGWYGFVEFDTKTIDRILKIAKEEGEELTGAEEELINDTAAVILFERSDGIVEADWFTGFDGKEKADFAWEEIEAEFEEEDEDDDEDEEEEENE